jgi:hypothetical protein
MRAGAFSVAAVAAVCAFAAPARADDGVKSELEALKRQIAEQGRRIRELEGKSPTNDEVAAAVDRYLGSNGPGATLVGGAGEGGKCGFASGSAPFIQEGDNKINFRFRNQFRYEGFHYSDDAVGTLASPANTISDAAPRDRTGFELERLFFGVDGTVFCPCITFLLTLNFDSDQVAGVEKEYAWLDWNYSGEHHIRCGTDKVPFTYEEQNSSASLAFVDRGLFAKAFGLDSDTGIMLWGNFGSCDCPKRGLYRFMASTGEGPTHSAGSVFNTDAFDTYSDQLLFTAMVEWTLTCKDWKWDEVDNRCEDRCGFDASIGIAAYYENDDDVTEKSPGLALRSTGPLDRYGLGAWFRARWNGWTLIAEAALRNVEYTADGSTAPEQEDSGAEITIHHRFCQSPWGIGVRGGIIWLDDDYDTLKVGQAVVDIEDTITELGVVVNYFVWDHNNKVSADVTWVQDNTAVKSSSAGYLWDPSKGVVVEDGIMFRLQWQVNF